MNIVEREAIEFYDEWFGGLLIHNIKNLNSRVTAKISDFTRDKDKLDFLKILREKIKRQQLSTKRIA
jgi:hypothetical protein